MPIELRILSGARAGQSQMFEKSVVAVGRHPLSDLRFDPTQDLDVSTTHGEIRGRDGRFVLYDSQSRNGTYVNRMRIPSGGSRELSDGDVVSFGEHGPSVSVHITHDEPSLVASGTHRAPAASAPPLAPPTPNLPAAPGAAARSLAAVATAEPPLDATLVPGQRRPTSVRVAEGVRQQTKWLRMGVAGAVVVLGGLAASVYYVGHRDSATRDAQIRALIAANEQITKDFETRLEKMNDTALTNSLRRATDSLTREVQSARTTSQSSQALARLQRNSEIQRKLVEIDMPAVRDQNDPAVVLVSTEITGNGFEATGFSARTSGVIVTNRHVVTDSAGTRATRIAVKFANTSRWLRAHVVKVGAGNVDLALLQIDDKGVYPTVRGVGSDVDTKVGGAIFTLGFPNGTELPMEGKGNDLVAKTSLVPGVVSKTMSDLLQIDSYATHGSSGSPVFDGHGHVVGVVWGGPPAPTPIVFAVPAGQIAELLRGVK